MGLATSSKGKVIDLVNGKAKLPNDLKVLNFVLLCDGYEEYELVGYPYSYKTYADGVLDGKFEAQSGCAKAVKQFTQYVDIIQGDNVIEHKLEQIILLFKYGIMLIIYYHWI